MKYFVTIDAEGRRTGTYTADHPAIPGGAIEIDEETFREWVESDLTRRWDQELGQLVACDPPAEPLEQVRARRQLEVDERLLAAFAAGMSYGGKTLQLREEDQQNIIAMSQRAALAQSGAVAWPSGFAWRMADNTFLALPEPGDMITLATAAADEVYRLRQVAWAHKDAIDALATAAEVEAYDIEVGW